MLYPVPYSSIVVQLVLKCKSKSNLSPGEAKYKLQPVYPSILVYNVWLNQFLAQKQSYFQVVAILY